MQKDGGKVIIPSGIDVWPHELETARIIAASGHTVEFLRKSEGARVKSADLSIDGVIWELKSPQSNQLKALERNLRKACKQSNNVIIDCRRMKGISDSSVEKELRRLASLVRGLRKLKLITHKKIVVDIK